MIGLFLLRMKLKNSGWPLNQAVLQEEPSQDLHIMHLRSIINISGLLVSTLRKVYGFGVLTISSGAATTSTTTTLCSSQGLSN